jgi:hypothetical protein
VIARRVRAALLALALASMHALAQPQVDTRELGERASRADLAAVEEL